MQPVIVQSKRQRAGTEKARDLGIVRGGQHGWGNPCTMMNMKGQGGDLDEQDWRGFKGYMLVVQYGYMEEQGEGGGKASKSTRVLPSVTVAYG